MPRYIEATEAIRVLSEYYHHRTDLQKYILAEAISKVPTADVVERKKGKWIKNNDSDHAWKCSFCGYGYTDNKLSYCYDCGAEMED